MQDARDLKARLRNEARARRDAVDAAVRAQWSLRIAEHGFTALRERAAARGAIRRLASRCVKRSRHAEDRQT